MNDIIYIIGLYRGCDVRLERPRTSLTWRHNDDTCRSGSWPQARPQRAPVSSNGARCLPVPFSPRRSPLCFSPSVLPSGLSATSPWPNSGVSAKLIATLAVLWAMMQQIGTFMVGGYVAGRMRSRWHEPTQHEIEFRDGLHGGLVWAVGIVIGAALVMATAGAAAKTGIDDRRQGLRVRRV